MAITLDGSNGITTPGGATTDDITFADNDKAIFGAGSDLQIYHDGTNSYLDNNTGALFMRNNGSVVIEDLSGDNIIRGIDGGAVDLYHNGASKITTTSTGVTVTGVMTANGTVNSAQAEFGTSSNRPLIIRSSNVGGYADDLTEFHKNSGVGLFSFSNTGGEMMRIDSSGNVLINRTSELHGGRLCLDYVGGTDAGIVLRDTTSSGTGVPMQFANGATTIIGSITHNQSSTSFNTSSDYRLKENVVDLTGASARVNQLNPSRFNFIVDDTNTLVDGFLAHEVATVVPEAINGTHNEVEVWKADEELPDGVSAGDNKLDDDGNTIPVYQGIDQSKLVPLLTAALQEALTEIASLKTRVEALEA